MKRTSFIGLMMASTLMGGCATGGNGSWHRMEPTSERDLATARYADPAFGVLAKCADDRYGISQASQRIARLKREKAPQHEIEAARREKWQYQYSLDRHTALLKVMGVDPMECQMAGPDESPAPGLRTQWEAEHAASWRPRPVPESGFDNPHELLAYLGGREKLGPYLPRDFDRLNEHAQVASLKYVVQDRCERLSVESRVPQARLALECNQAEAAIEGYQYHR